MNKENKKQLKEHNVYIAAELLHSAVQSGKINLTTYLTLMNKTEVYKTQADPIIDKLQQGFKIDLTGQIAEEISEEVWVMEINNTKGIVYLFGNEENFKDGEDFANKAREYALNLVNNK